MKVPAAPPQPLDFAQVPILEVAPPAQTPRVTFVHRPRIPRASSAVPIPRVPVERIVPPIQSTVQTPRAWFAHTPRILQFPSPVPVPRVPTAKFLPAERIPPLTQGPQGMRPASPMHYPALPEDALTEVQKSLEKKSTEEQLKKVVEFSDLTLRVHDFYTLADGQLINSEVLNLYFNLLQERGKNENQPTVYALDTNFYSTCGKVSHDETVRMWGLRKKNTLDYELLLFPIHSGPRLDGHWSFAGVDTVNLVVHNGDSLNYSIKDTVISAIIKFLNEEARRRGKEFEFVPSFTESKMPRQSNGIDCGVFVAFCRALRPSC